jgi:4-hydroxy-tetrahydrodipicolinate reductase
MKIALIGYGKMGREIEKIAMDKGHEIVLKINAVNIAELTADNLSKAEVAIEFSTPHTVVSNIELCASIGLPIVVGTTAWYADFEKVKSIIAEGNASLFYATNFSIGVNLFFKINEMAAKLMRDFDFELSMDEIHHTHKLDAPSGTAITTAEKIMQHYSAKKTWENKIVTDTKEARDTKKNAQELLIRSIRKDEVPGTHTVYYDSDVDTIEISHIAHNRKGFAKGAVSAAEWIVGKKGIYNMDDLLSFEK